MGATRVLVLGGCGFLGSHVVEELRKRGCEVVVVDDLSSCQLEEEVEGGHSRTVGPRFLPPDVPWSTRLPEDLDFDSLVVCSLRHPVERERALYGVGFDGLVALTMRVVLRWSPRLRRVVVAATRFDAAGERDPASQLHEALFDLLSYWHRPPGFATYFVQLPELEGERRLPETLPVEGAPVASVERAAWSVAAAAVEMRHRVEPRIEVAAAGVAT